MPNKIKCSHILVEKQSQALQLIERINSGEKFGRLAKENSIDAGSSSIEVMNSGPFEELDIMNEKLLREIVTNYKITQVYLLAAFRILICNFR